MGAGQGQTLLSSTPLCFVLLWGSIFVCFLSSSLGWAGQGSYIPLGLGFFNVMHQGRGDFSSQLWCLSLSQVQDVHNPETSQSSLTARTLTAAVWLEVLQVDLQSFRLKKEKHLGSMLPDKPSLELKCPFYFYFFPEAYLYCVKTVDGIITGLWSTHC